MAADSGHISARAARVEADRSLLRQRGVLCICGLPGSGRSAWAETLADDHTRVVDRRDAFVSPDAIVAELTPSTDRPTLLLCDRFIRAFACVEPPRAQPPSRHPTSPADADPAHLDAGDAMRLYLATDGHPLLFAAALDAVRRFRVEDVVRALSRLSGAASDLDGGGFASRVAATLEHAPAHVRRLLVHFALREPTHTLEPSESLAHEPALATAVDHGWVRATDEGRYALHPCVEGVVREHPVCGDERQWWVRTHWTRGHEGAPLGAEDGWLDRFDRLALPATLRHEVLCTVFYGAYSDPVRREPLDAWLRARAPHDAACALVGSASARARSHPETAVALLAPWVDDPTIGPEARIERARALYMMGRTTDARADLDGAHAHLPRSARAHALRLVGALAFASDDVAGAIDAANRAIDAAIAADDPYEEARGLGLRAAVYAASLHIERARVDARRAFRALDAHPDAVGRVSALLTIAEIHLHAAETERAVQTLDAALTLLGTEEDALRATVHGLHALAHLDQHRVRAAREVIEDTQRSLAQRSRRTDAWLDGIRLLALHLDPAADPPSHAAWASLVERLVAMPDVRLARLFAGLAAAAHPSLPLLLSLHEAGPEGQALLHMRPEDARLNVWVRLARRLPSASTAHINPTGRGFSLPVGPPIDLGRRGTARRLLAELARIHEESAGPASFDALIAHLWPDDRSSHTSLRARLHVAVSELRRAGLREHIETTESGYRLVRVRIDPRVRLDHEPLATRTDGPRRR
jgi:tetratricopeptide (TPR) repeat protein